MGLSPPSLSLAPPLVTGRQRDRTTVRFTNGSPKNITINLGFRISDAAVGKPHTLNKITFSIRIMPKADKFYSYFV